jgi:thioredoxin reductase (NADPH)
MNPAMFVLGAGPAGMSAALWLKQYGFQPVLIEREPKVGGLQAVSDYPNPFLLGWVGKTANEVADAFGQHMVFERIAVIHGKVEALTPDSKGWELRFADSSTPLRFWGGVVATGTRWERLEVPGATAGYQARRVRHLGHGSALSDAHGQQVVVLGGGDNAFSIALELARIAVKVVVLARGEVRALGLLRSQLAQLKNVEVRSGHEVVEVKTESVTVSAEGKTYEQPAAFVYVALGFKPNTEELQRWLPKLALDSKGYILADADGRTTVPFLWAAGDICNPIHPCTATAIALGTVAARNMEWTTRHPSLAWTLREGAMPPG